jgi:hypothetical protein
MAFILCRCVVPPAQCSEDICKNVNPLYPKRTYTLSLGVALAQMGQVSQKYIIASESEFRALRYGDVAVKRFFSNNPDATLVVDFGDATEIGDNFGYNREDPFLRPPEEIRRLIIKGDKLTKVGDKFFYLSNELTTLILPDTITEIGDDFHVGCSKLSSIVLPKGLTRVGKQFLCLCYGLNSLNLPDSLTKVGFGFLAGCNLNTLILPNGLTSVGNWFLFCCSTKLKPRSVLVKRGTAIYDVFFGESPSYRPYVSPSCPKWSEDPEYVKNLLKAVDEDGNELPPAGADAAADAVSGV